MTIPQTTAKKGTMVKSGFSGKLLAWYDRHARQLPWRIPPLDSKSGELPDPYHVWLSEIMLQQTQVATVRDYYLKFLSLWPSVDDLANAETEDVMKAWAGLGYYSRARNLKKCAEIVSRDMAGQFPLSAEALKKLPGIGDYTAAAISAIAFRQPAPVVDGNIERIITRQFMISEPMPKAKNLVRDHVLNLLTHERPGDFAQAMMDLGASLCSPKNPACSLCPVNKTCKAYETNTAEAFPVKLPKIKKPTRQGAAFVIFNERDEIFLQKRPDSGLLGGMTEIPGTQWTARQDGLTGADCVPFVGNWENCGVARHTFTHFHLELEVWQTNSPLKNDNTNNGWWASKDELHREALPTVMKKAIAVALPDIFKGKK